MLGVGDLHTHTSSSDGVLTPNELLIKAKSVGLAAISITDHDNVDGVRKALDSEHIKDILLIPGIELSCFENGKEYHILGYMFDIDNKALNVHIEEYRKTRITRAKLMHQKLKSLGLNINFDDILEIAGNAPITRPHIAQAIKTAGYIDNLKDAFYKYIGDGGPAYQAKPYYPVENGIKLINNAGGVAVLAHPGNFVEPAVLYKMIENGLDGIEVIHPIHNETQRRFYSSVSSQYWLLQTGGSDYHGNRDYDEVNFGKEVVSSSIIDSLVNRVKM